MFGSRSLCLLAVVVVTQASPLSLAQADRLKASPILLKSAPEFSHVPVRLPAPQPPLRFPASPPADTSFQHIVRDAGMIFSGTVSRVERHPATRGHSLETIAITFHIENSIRGTTPGREVTISQWSGLWSSGQRYRVGERVLLFLYPRSKLGLTSVVAGPMGRFDIDSWNRVVLSARHLSLFRMDPVLGGKSRVSISDFASAVRQACEEE
jgi:hypothetical protein